MDKNTLLKAVNTVLGISGLVQIVTSLGIFFSPSFLGSRALSALGEIHEYNGLLFIALILTHISLNWGWVRSQFRKR